MFVPPNWVGVGTFAMLGMLNPGFWILGVGLELGYLYVLVTNPRFQRTVEAGRLAQAQRREGQRILVAMADLRDEDRRRYRALEGRCQSILESQRILESSPDLLVQREGLGRLLRIYLRLLLTRDSIGKIARSVTGEDSLPQRIKKLQEQIKDTSLGEELRKSLSAQLDILQQRLRGQQEAASKLEVVHAELTRVEEQIELIREQAMLAADPAAVSQRIDQIAADLGGTTQWIREQQQIYGKVGDLLEEPPSLQPRHATEAPE